MIFHLPPAIAMVIVGGLFIGVAFIADRLHQRRTRKQIYAIPPRRPRF